MKIEVHLFKDGCPGCDHNKKSITFRLEKAASFFKAHWEINQNITISASCSGM